MASFDTNSRPQTTTKGNAINNKLSKCSPRNSGPRLQKLDTAQIKEQRKG